jgi:cytochrome bd ubiquinol oxidase subunit II
MIFDYETLKMIWWAFVGVLLIGFALTDGFDMGIGTLLPFLGKNDEERRVIINSIGPTWEGNQTWFITAGGATFAAWPMVYATAFSGFYVALMLVLFALFFRPVGFDYRSKLENPTWRSAWDWGLFAGGTVPTVVFGVAFGNLLLGVPFHFDDTMRVFYTGSFWQLLNPFALLCGVVSLAMLVMHGATFLQMRTEGVIQSRAARATVLAAGVLVVSFAAAGLWISAGIDGYRVTQVVPGGIANPLAKTVEVRAGAWLDNYQHYGWMIVAPIAGFGGAFAAAALSLRRHPRLALVTSGLSVTGVILTAGFSMFPFVMPSSSHPNSSLTAWDAVSSHGTLQIMFWVTIFFLPVVCVYTTWVYRVLRGKVTVESVRASTHTAY